MAYIYRYTDLVDGIIKYVGIIWGNSRTLQQRLNEHEKNDRWCYTRRWKIEYIEIGINNRTEAEFFESHFISLYATNNYYNSAKSKWGTSKLVPFGEQDWKEYTQEIKTRKQTDIEKAQKTISKLQKEIKKMQDDLAFYRQLRGFEVDAYYAFKEENMRLTSEQSSKIS